MTVVTVCKASHAVTSGAVPTASAAAAAGSVLGVEGVMSVCMRCADAPGRLMASESSTSLALGCNPT